VYITFYQLENEPLKLKLKNIVVERGLLTPLEQNSYYTFSEKLSPSATSRAITAPSGKQ
jgi:hypothetical protein